MHEIQSGKRRDGLLAKAVTSTAGDQTATKLAYFKLLVQAIRDDDKIAQEHALQSSTPLQFPVKKPSLLKTMWFWFLVVLATMILVFGFLPVILDGGATFVQWIIAGFWLVVIDYALKKIFPSAKT